MSWFELFCIHCIDLFSELLHNDMSLQFHSFTCTEETALTSDPWQTTLLRPRCWDYYTEYTCVPLLAIQWTPAIPAAYLGTDLKQHQDCTNSASDLRSPRYSVLYCSHLLSPQCHQLYSYYSRKWRLWVWSWSNVTTTKCTEPWTRLLMKFLLNLLPVLILVTLSSHKRNTQISYTTYTIV